ncbi:MAG: HNH endonuclease [Bacteroidota bacterium]|nr:HNH endonuclease [Bacteroidota bacterium]MDE2957330.1 HNH endonuclease [Bacteroidota bacterium]
MKAHVLVLNQDFSALTVCSVQRAFVLIHLDKADLVESLPQAVLRTPRRHFAWPSIVRLRSYVRVPFRRIMLSRKNVLRRDGFRCQYCNQRERLTVDHVVPRSRGGKDQWTNLVAACIRCNNRKGDRTPEEARMKLRRKPFRPSHVTFIRDYVGQVEDSWKPYLFLS